MDVDDLLRFLAVNPSQLDPAPPQSPHMIKAHDRLGILARPCVRCGHRASFTGIVDIPGHGNRWIDRCRNCFLATVQRGGPSGPLEQVLAVLADAARDAGVQLTVVIDHSGDPPRLDPQVPDSPA